MEWVKTTAKTLPEAIDLALDNLGVDESEAEIVVLEEPRPGLFGRIRGTARVEARVKPKPIRPKTERNRNRRSRDEGGDRNRNKNRNRNRNRGEGSGRSGTKRDSAEGGESKSSAGASNGGGERSRSGGRSGGGDGRQRSGGGRSRSGRGNGAGRSANQDRGRQRSNSGGEAKAIEGAPVEEVEAHLRGFLTELNEAFGFDSGVSIDDSEEGTLVGRIDGRHGLLVGPKGRTLDAVQELARISCQRATPSNVRIKVDVGGYREQRANALADFARNAADKAVSDGDEVALEPMSPADRKSVHDALNGDDRVETRSAGSEPRRRVVVVPLDVDEDDEDFDDDLEDAAEDAAESTADAELTEVEDGAEAASDDEE